MGEQVGAVHAARPGQAEVVGLFVDIHRTKSLHLVHGPGLGLAQLPGAREPGTDHIAEVVHPGHHLGVLLDVAKQLARGGVRVVLQHRHGRSRRRGRREGRLGLEERGQGQPDQGGGEGPGHGNS